MCAFLVFVSLPVSATDIIKIGVDHCTSPVMERLTEAFGKKTGTYFRLIPGLCPSWVKKVEEGEVDVGGTTQFVTDVPKGCSNVVIAKTPIALIVNKKNKVKNLSLEQLQRI
ncbi:MAG: substrate-binding domain-containing protein, partial [Candidatus Brocadiales bacterium]